MREYFIISRDFTFDHLETILNESLVICLDLDISIQYSQQSTFKDLSQTLKEGHQTIWDFEALHSPHHI